MSLWISQQGVVACGKNGHGGFYLERLLENDEKVGKRREEYSTPLDHWIRINTDADLTKNIRCEQCEEEKKRA